MSNRRPPVNRRRQPESEKDSLDYIADAGRAAYEHILEPGYRNIVKPTVEGVDWVGRKSSEHVLLPFLNALVKLSALGVLRGVDQFRVRALEKDALEGGEWDKSVRQGYGKVEESLASMDPKRKIWAHRMVYMAALLSAAALAIGVSDRSSSNNADIPAIAAPENPGRGVGRGSYLPPRVQRPRVVENMPASEQMPEIDNLAVMSVYEYDGEDAWQESQSGLASFYETLDQFLYELTGPESRTSNISRFRLYKEDGRGGLTEMRVTYGRGVLKIDGEAVRMNRTRRGRYRFQRNTLHRIAAYKVVEDGITYMGIRPQASNDKLNDYIEDVTSDNPEVAMLHFRGHTDFGERLMIPASTLDPVIVNLGGCDAGDNLSAAARTHSGKALIARKVGTNWTANHGIAKTVMELLQRYSISDQNPTWGEFSDDLRTETSLLATDAVLPGDQI